MEPKLFANIKTGKLYGALTQVTDATNSCPKEEQIKTLYIGLEDDDLFVRDSKEFKEKFKPALDFSNAPILDRQLLGIKYPMIDFICGFVAKVEAVDGPLILSEQQAYLDLLKPEEEALGTSMLSLLGSVIEMEAAGFFKPLLVKIQRPITSNMESPPCLVYNEDRTFMHEMAMDSGIMDFFEEGDLKIYAHARLWANGTFQVVCTTEAQDW